MLHTSRIELSREALASNIRYLRGIAGKRARFSCVIKANAYGHGIEETVPMLRECGVDHFSVFSSAEAYRAHEAMSDDCELMIMGWVEGEDLDWAIARGVSFFVFNRERLEAADAAAKRVGRRARVHLELETGMHRTGFRENQLPEVVEGIRANGDTIAVEGVCTHLAGAESIVNHRRIQAQIRSFRELCGWLHEQGIRPKSRHVACSAGLLRYPESIFDLVRVGIASYGFWPTDELRMQTLLDQDDTKDPLKRMLSWKSTVMSVNEVEEGEFVSYGHSFLTNRKSRIAVVPVGYGYGFSRTLSNRGHVLIRGRRVPVIGSVNMNMVVVDATDVEDVGVGDEVVLIGKQGDRMISVGSFSDMNNALNYELLTRLPGHIPRVVVD